MNTVLVQELMRYNGLLKTVRNSLDQLAKAIDGFVTMSNDLDEVMNKMFDNLVPELWQKVLLFPHLLLFFLALGWLPFHEASGLLV